MVTALVKDGKEVDSLKAGESGAIVLNQTPFYAESGGQVGDTGLLTGEGVKFRVTDTQKKAGDLFVHLGTVEQGTLKVGTALQLEVDHARRSSIRAHHSATHLLHEALRQVLGDHIAQRGSLVAPDRLRFDFVHPKPITAEELARVEDIANDVVLENDEVTTRLMAVDDAREAGARALFGEKYGDEVRVVSMGKSRARARQNALGWSVELCGGTHVRRTGDIGLISVTGESAVASGVRRIEALTGRHARKHANDTMALAKTAAAELRTTVDDMPARIAALMEERKKLERDLSDARKKLAMGGGATNGGGGGRRRARSRQRQAAGARGRGHRDQGSQEPGRRRQEADRLRRGRDRRRHRGRQGRHRGRRHQRSHLALQRGRSGAQGLRSARRQGRRRPARHGAGRRPRWRQGGRGAVGDRKGDGRRLSGCEFVIADAQRTSPQLLWLARSRIAQSGRPARFWLSGQLR